MPMPIKSDPEARRPIPRLGLSWARSGTSPAFSFHGWPRLRLVILAVYTVTIFCIVIWMASGPRISTWQWVLRTGDMKVNQLYSGFLLSALLLPVAILLRQLYHDFGLLHPFAIASKESVSLRDLDRMLDLGPTSVWSVGKYSKWKAVVQVLLMSAGALLVPVGTLSVTTGTFTPAERFSALAGMPVLDPTGLGPSKRLLRKQMGHTGDGPFIPKFDDSDYFLKAASDAWKGILLTGKSWMSGVPGTLGPVATRDMPFVVGARYEGLVTFNWNLSCVQAKDEVSYRFEEQDGRPLVFFRLPDGTGYNDTYPMLFPFHWSNATEKTATGIPIGGTLFIVTALPASLIAEKSYKDIIDVEGDRLIFRMKCTHSFDWQLSSCLYNGTSWQNCRDSPNSNATALDTVGLDALTQYMTGVVWSLMLKGDYVLALSVYSISSLPPLPELTGIVGTLAQTLAALATAGAYGYASVSATGGPPRYVYIARVPVVIAVLSVLLAANAFLIGDIIYNIRRRLPFRKMSFITISSAVSGPSPEHEYYCDCVVPEDEGKDPGYNKVMYGILDQPAGHVGLGRLREGG